MASKFDFETLYRTYPRRGESKTKGMKKLQETIRSEEDYIRFSKSLKNYIELCQVENRERTYIKHWSTFVNNWEDYENAEDLGLSSGGSGSLRVVT